MRRLILAFAALLAVFAQAQAQSTDGAEDKQRTQKEQPGEQRFTFYGKEKVMAGNQHYRNSDTSIDIGLPYDVDLNADLTAFKSDSSSMTPTITLGAGKSWGQFSLSGTYAISPLANDARSMAYDLIASAHSDSEDFRTTVSGDVLVTHNNIYIRFPMSTKEVDITQRTPTIALKQQIYKTRVEASFSEYTYNVDIPFVAAVLNGNIKFNGASLAKYAHFTGGLSGLISGFPDHSEKFSVYQDVGVVPLTLWTSYESIHFIDTVLQLRATSDTLQYGADYDLSKILTVSAQYNHVRETGQIITDEYGLALSARF